MWRCLLENIQTQNVTTFVRKDHISQLFCCHKWLWKYDSSKCPKIENFRY